MLEHIAELEGAAETLPGGREASVVRTKLQEARFAEMERLRVKMQRTSDDTLEQRSAEMVEMARVVEEGLARGRAHAVAIAGEAVPSGSSNVQRSP